MIMLYATYLLLIQYFHRQNASWTQSITQHTHTITHIDTHTHFQQQLL